MGGPSYQAPFLRGARTTLGGPSYQAPFLRGARITLGGPSYQAPFLRAILPSTLFEAAFPLKGTCLPALAALTPEDQQKEALDRWGKVCLRWVDEGGVTQEASRKEEDANTNCAAGESNPGPPGAGGALTARPKSRCPPPTHGVGTEKLGEGRNWQLRRLTMAAPPGFSWLRRVSDGGPVVRGQALLLSPPFLLLSRPFLLAPFLRRGGRPIFPGILFEAGGRQ